MLDACADALTRLARDFVSDHHCPSLSWGVVVDGELALHGGAGVLDDGTAPTERTVYRIASMTKSFTATVVLRLRDQGVLQLDDPIARHAPELAAVRSPSADAPPITIADLLSMTSGLATDDAWADRHLDITDAELDALIERGLLFAAPTGTGFEYSNLGYALLGRVVKRASGHRVQDLVTHDVLLPLRMNRTTWIEPAHQDWARPYHRAGGEVRREPQLVGDGELAPMGGIWTCIADLARWIAFFTDAFPARDGADHDPLSRASRRDMQQMHRYNGVKVLGGRPAPTGYGYGLLVRDDPAVGTTVGHSGGLPGYGSNMRWLAGRQVGVVALANLTYAPAAELTLRMLDKLHDAGVPGAHHPAPPVHVVDVAHRLVELLNRDTPPSAGEDLFADNLHPDEPIERRLAAAAAVIGGRGPLRVERIDAATDAAGRVVALDATSAPVTITFDLAPLLPPAVQSFTVSR